MYENVFLALQQDFYSKSRHASPQNSSQIYAYVSKNVFVDLIPFCSQLLLLPTKRCGMSFGGVCLLACECM